MRVNQKSQSLVVACVAPGRLPGPHGRGSPAAPAQFPPAHLLTHAAGGEGSSLLHFCFVDGTDAKGHLHTQHADVADVR